MKKINSSIMAVSIAIAAITSITSCEKENLPKGVDSRFVTFKVTTENTPMTKAGLVRTNSFETVDLSNDALELYMTGTESVINDAPWTKPLTKAAESNTQSLVDNGFNVVMATEAGNVTGWAKHVTDSYWQFIKSGVSKDQYNVNDDSQRIMWPEGGKEAAEIWAYYGMGSFTTNNISYSFSPRDDKNDALNMKDILVAKSAEQFHEHSESNCVRLHFFHPLSEVKFEIDEAVNISRVEINKVYAGGTVSYNTSESFNPYGDGAYENAFGSWSFDGQTKVTYAQVTNKSKDFTFFVVPQGLEEVSFTFYVNDAAGNEYPLSTKTLGTSAWNSGMRYTYKLTNAATGEVSIDITEQGNIQVENKEYSAIYVRAAVVGVYTKENAVIGSWTPSENDINIKETGWFLNATDGYYYYKKPVLGYDTIKEDLISNITKSGTENLEVHVAVQAVPYDKKQVNIKAAWKNVDVSKLDVL